MVAPVTGPFTKTITLKGPSNKYGYTPTWIYITREWYRQKRPYDRPLGFNLSSRRVRGASDSYENSRDYSQSATFRTDQADLAHNKSYGKLVEAVGDPSLWAVNLAEYGQSLSMMEKRLVQLTKFAKKLHHFDFPGAANELRKGMTPPKGLKAGTKYFADNWLEYHFGWEPLVKDIGAAVHTLTAPVPPKRISGKGTVRKTQVDDNQSSTPYWSRQVDVISTSSKHQADVRVESPNVHLAEQLGFVNPLAVAWELVPFSFVVDWFSNVGQVLGSLTDFAGLSITNASTSTLQTIQRTELSYTGFQANYESVYCTRALGITGPVLAITPWKGVSVTRGITACSLLLQQMR